MKDQPLRLHVTCRHLRHKLMYVDERHATIGLVDDSSDTRVFWCELTQNCLGPDSEPVDEDHCLIGRECYEAI